MAPIMLWAAVQQCSCNAVCTYDLSMCAITVDNGCKILNVNAASPRVPASSSYVGKHHADRQPLYIGLHQKKACLGA